MEMQHYSGQDPKWSEVKYKSDASNQIKIYFNSENQKCMIYIESIFYSIENPFQKAVQDNNKLYSYEDIAYYIKNKAIPFESDVLELIEDLGNIENFDGYFFDKKVKESQIISIKETNDFENQDPNSKFKKVQFFEIEFQEDNQEDNNKYKLKAKFPKDNFKESFNLPKNHKGFFSSVCKDEKMFDGNKFNITEESQKKLMDCYLEQEKKKNPVQGDMKISQQYQEIKLSKNQPEFKSININQYFDSKKQTEGLKPKWNCKRGASVEKVVENELRDSNNSELYKKIYNKQCFGCWKLKSDAALTEEEVKQLDKIVGKNKNKIGKLSNIVGIANQF